MNTIPAACSEACPKIILYLCGVGGNIGDYNYLARASAFRQLGFSVLMFDYRGYGLSQGSFPSEAQLYADSEAAWNYLRNNRHISADQILVYGESLGGAIAINLAVQHPEAGGLIVQSSFKSMAAVINRRSMAKFLPVNRMLSERFDSHTKVSALQMPVLFLHGSEDTVVSAEMSQQLYALAPEPKQLFLIAGAEHVRLYQPGAHSYLRGIQSFIKTLPE